jgi:hypothetical protein
MPPRNARGFLENPTVKPLIAMIDEHLRNRNLPPLEIDRMRNCGPVSPEDRYNVRIRINPGSGPHVIYGHGFYDIVVLREKLVRVVLPLLDRRRGRA